MIKGRHRLPSGFGTIRRLGGNRTRPYAVHPPAVKEYTDSLTVWKRPAAICYVSSWDVGLKVLALYHTGLYKVGIEDLIENREPIPVPETKDALCMYCQNVLEDIEKIKSGALLPGSSTGKEHKGETVGSAENITESAEKSSPTFEEVYQAFFDYKYGSHAQKKLSKSTRNSTNAAYQRFSPFYAKTLDEISVDDLQALVNSVADAGYSKSTVSRCVTLAHQIYRFAYPREMCNKESGKYVEMPAVKIEEHHQDFTDEELKILWANYKLTQDPIIRTTLVMCYSGFRVNEYDDEGFRINKVDGFFQGGFKTEAGRDRIVPIHSAILPLVNDTVDLFNGKSTDVFREEMKAKMVEIGIDGKVIGEEVRYHTPHSCRHTFSRLCESYEVNEADRKRMLGHSLRNDVTNGVYGHRTIKELREQIEKIEAIPALKGASLDGASR